jgi:hypothetical protein
MSRAIATALMLFSAALVAACTTSDVLEPSAMVGSTPATTSATPAPTTPMPPAATTEPGAATAALVTHERIQVAPIVGATVEAVTPLTERLARRARESGIALAGSADGSATRVLKGYLAVESDAGVTTVHYVWDVLDMAGNRLHRIQGQAKVPGARNDDWASVPDGVMQSIADDTMTQLTGWLAGNSG